MVRAHIAFRITIATSAFVMVFPAIAVEPRTISGILVEPKTRAPIRGQKLVLDRPPGDYDSIPFAMLIFGTPQAAIIATAVTDRRGRFRFITAKDRGRSLEIRISGSAPSDFRSRAGYAVTRLSDSLYSDKPRVSFDAHIMHSPRGGFMPVPRKPSNQAVQRTATRRAFTLRWLRRLHSGPSALISSRPRSVAATLRGFAVYPAAGGRRSSCSR